MPKTLDLQTQKNQLVERIGVYIENKDQLPPLAARIYATLTLTGNDGITFEQLVNDLNASKSTVCTHLNTLQANEMASYFTKPGDRKRYFIVAPNRFTKVIDEMIERWNDQQQIQRDIIDYKQLANTINSQTPEFDLNFHLNYLEFLDEASHLVKKLKQNILNNNSNNE